MTKPVATVIGPDGGEKFHVGPLAIRTLITREQAGGAFEMHEVALGEGTVDYHVHHLMDETIHVIEGTIEFTVEGKVSREGPGGVAFIPKGLHHGFSNRGPAPAKVIITFSPATGQDDYFRALESLLAEGYSTGVEALQKKYDQELVPLPA